MSDKEIVSNRLFSGRTIPLLGTVKGFTHMLCFKCFLLHPHVLSIVLYKFSKSTFKIYLKNVIVALQEHKGYIIVPPKHLFVELTRKGIL